MRVNERRWGLFLELVHIIESVFDGIDSDDIIEKLLYDHKAAEILNRIIPEIDDGRNVA